MVQNLKSTKEYMVKNKSLLPILPDSISSNPVTNFLQCHLFLVSHRVNVS